MKQWSRCQEPTHPFDLLSPHEALRIRLIGFEGDSVVIEDRKRRTVPQNLGPQRWGVK
jgi:hypothetical protein